MTMHIARLIDRIPDFLKFAEPFTTMQRALSNYFRSHREMGSRDRRMFRSIVYSNRRLGYSLPLLDEKLRTLIGIYLTGELDWSSVKEGIEATPFKEWPSSDSIADRINQVRLFFTEFREEALFPFSDLVSPEIELKDFRISMLVPPKVHIRIRRGQGSRVEAELARLGIGFHRNVLEGSLSFEQGVDLESLDCFKEGCFEVQDLSSQFVSAQYAPKAGESWWDVCAASGGKSLGLLDKCDDIALLASDVRPTILDNLSKRLGKAGLSAVDVQLIDASIEEDVPGAPFDCIIADVPCTGSGTWARTPERIMQFDTTFVLAHYVPLQKGILRGVTKQLKLGGKVHYSTCSVFRAENENIVNWMVDTLGYRLVSMNYFSRYFDRADTLFSAILTR